MHFIQLKNQHGKVFYDKLTFIYLTLPHFKKTLEQLESLQDKWFYIFKHLHELQDIPAALNEAVFLKLFDVAQIACFDAAERQAYQDSLKYYRDLKNVTDTAWGEGWEEGMEIGAELGRKKGREEGFKEGEYQKALAIAQQLLEVLDDETIALKTGLALDTIRALR